MHHIDQIRLAYHPDPRMREAASAAARLRSELWRFVLGRVFSGLFAAVSLPFRREGDAKGDMRVDHQCGSPT